MRHVNALLLKLTAYLLIFGLTLPVLGRLALPRSLILAAIHTLLLWLADQIILPRFGRTAALVGDFLLLVVGSFLVLGAMGAVPRPLGLILAVLLGTGFEAWFHLYLRQADLLDS
ncbi:MAG: DUF2512 family protein [Bacillota bacterium]